MSIEALAELAEAAELLRGERDWFRWTEESDMPDVVLALIRAVEAARHHRDGPLSECIPWLNALADLGA